MMSLRMTATRGHQRFFAGATQALVKALEDWVMSDRAQGSHVKSTAHRSTSTADASDATDRTAVVIVGRHAG